MMKKLIRYDLAWSVRLPAYYAAFALLSLGLFYLTGLWTGASIGVLIHQILFGVTISLAISTLVNTVIRCWVRFTHTSYKDESYLYHTLPVARATLFRAHLWSFVLLSAGAAIFALGCIWLLLLKSTVTVETVRSFLGTARGPVFAAALILTVLFEVLCVLICGILGTVIGYSFSSSRTLKSVLFSAGIYGAANLLLLPVLLLASLLDPRIRDVFTLSNAAVFAPWMWKIPAVAALYYLFCCVLAAFAAKRLYLKKINVD